MVGLIVIGPLLVVAVAATIAVAFGRAWGALIIAGFGALVVVLDVLQGPGVEPFILVLFGGGAVTAVAVAVVLGGRSSSAAPGALEQLARLTGTILGGGLSLLLGLVFVWSLNPVLPIPM
jgi:hypothetical protein